MTDENASYQAADKVQSTEKLTGLISTEDLVGDLLKIDYTECEVLVHDHLRQKVGGLPLGCFLLATRLKPGAGGDPSEEDSSLILLRVVGQCRLPNASEMDQNRFMAGQRSAHHDDTWDAEGQTDQFTLNQLRFAGVRCRVLGTFRVRESADSWQIKFGSDISNFYSGRGMKVYKPVGAALSSIVNYTKSALDDSHPLAGAPVAVGRVRYASSERKIDQSAENVAVNLDPTDLIARRTALFGMSRTGKSNTTKVIASSVFELRAQADSGRVGILIFDPNGEYANENTQDAGCLKNIATSIKGAKPDDVVTYGMSHHPNDPNRKIVKINFYGTNPSKWDDVDQLNESMEPLLVGKQLINDHLNQNHTSNYITEFRSTDLEPPQVLDFSSATRYRRAITVYRAVLAEAGFSLPQGATKANTASLFSKELVAAMKASPDTDNETEYKAAAATLENSSPSWSALASALRSLRKFIQEATNSGYKTFNDVYIDKKGHNWHDDRLTGMLALFQYTGPKLLKPLIPQHDPQTTSDYADSIVGDLHQGRLVIFDQSLGDPEMNKAAAERVMWAVFNHQKAQFVNPEKDANGALIPPRDVLVFAEEAHNLLPASTSSDVSAVWSRAAKEGSKYRIGIVYATQEPSSIQSNILKNTDNWFVAHLNNSDETRELKKYYDFEDFVDQILRVPDPGFLRMRALSNPYIVPVQIKKFQVSM
nr:DUF87 domain-containing protein [uncultured Hyphomonas sp.]